MLLVLGKCTNFKNRTEQLNDALADGLVSWETNYTPDYSDGAVWNYVLPMTSETVPPPPPTTY